MDFLGTSQKFLTLEADKLHHCINNLGSFTALNDHLVMRRVGFTSRAVRTVKKIEGVGLEQAVCFFNTGIYQALVGAKDLRFCMNKRV